ncbi:MAG: hypothetical protein R6U70_08550 [Bacillota bacterium]
MAEENERGGENRRRRSPEQVLRDRGVYQLPDIPEVEEPAGADGPVEFDWKDVLAFIIASYQIIFPFLGLVLAVFLVIWGVLWLLSL